MAHGLSKRVVTLILAICGENNAFTDLLSSSPFKRPRDLGFLQSAIATQLADPWIVLNPAHRPYWPHIWEKGFGKVGRVGQSTPILQRLVGKVWKPGAIPPPLAVVHCNNYLRRNLSTLRFAARAFVRRSTLNGSRASILVPVMRTTSSTTMLLWKYAEFEIALPAAQVPVDKGILRRCVS